MSSPRSIPPNRSQYSPDFAGPNGTWPGRGQVPASVRYSHPQSIDIRFNDPPGFGLEADYLTQDDIDRTREQNLHPYLRAQHGMSNNLHCVSSAPLSPIDVRHESQALEGPTTSLREPEGLHPTYYTSIPRRRAHTTGSAPEQSTLPAYHTSLPAAHSYGSFQSTFPQPLPSVPQASWDPDLLSSNLWPYPDLYMPQNAGSDIAANASPDLNNAIHHDAIDIGGVPATLLDDSIQAKNTTSALTLRIKAANQSRNFVSQRAASFGSADIVNASPTSDQKPKKSRRQLRDDGERQEVAEKRVARTVCSNCRGRKVKCLRPSADAPPCPLPPPRSRASSSASNTTPSLSRTALSPHQSPYLSAMPSFEQSVTSMPLGSQMNPYDTQGNEVGALASYADPFGSPMYPIVEGGDGDIVLDFDLLPPPDMPPSDPYY